MKHTYTLVGTKCENNWGGIALYTRDDQTDWELFYVRDEYGETTSKFTRSHVHYNATNEYIIHNGRRYNLGEFETTSGKYTVEA